MNTKKMKRWNGDVTKLSATYLKNVVEKMLAYGETVKFSKLGSVDGPNYQVINKSGKMITFDSNNLLTHPADDEFTSITAQSIYSLDQIKIQLIKASAPVSRATVTKARKAPSPTSARGGSAAARAKEQIALQKYEYYKTNRQSLPSDIREHSEEITRMMESGMSAELAFGEAVKLCYAH